MASKDELILRALSVIGVVSQGQTPSDDDREIVSKQITPLLEQLARMEVLYVADTTQIDDSVFLPLSIRLALQIGPDFGLPAMTPDQRRVADNEIRIVQASRQAMQPLKTEYF